MRFLVAFLSMVAAVTVPGITTHVLDISKGLPGKGVEVTVFRQKNEGPVSAGDWELMRTV